MIQRSRQTVTMDAMSTQVFYGCAGRVNNGKQEPAAPLQAGEDREERDELCFHVDVGSRGLVFGVSLRHREPRLSLSSPECCRRRA